MLSALHWRLPRRSGISTALHSCQFVRSAFTGYSIFQAMTAPKRQGIEPPPPSDSGAPEKEVAIALEDTTGPPRNPTKGVRTKTRARARAEAEVLGRPPAVNSSYVPVPWKGRLGYVRSPGSGLFWYGMEFANGGVCRLVRIPTSALQTLQFSALVPVGSPRY